MALFRLVETVNIGPVLANLAKQDRRYEIDEEYLSHRVRVDKDFFRTAQDDASVVFSTPWSTDDDDLPFVFSFKLVEGKLIPSSSKFAVQQISALDVALVNQFEIFSDKILYARCKRYCKLDGAVFNSDQLFNNIDWLPGTNQLTFSTIRAIPSYNERTNPFLIALDNTSSKLVMINSSTKAVFDIAVLKRNHESDLILQGSI